MPYRLEGNCVYKGDKELKCYDNHEDALAYFRALKLNVQESLVEHSMFITKNTKSADGKMKWSAVNSDTEWDLYGERMTIQLYQKMLSRIEKNEPPPPQFKEMVCSDYWCGGMPYLSIAHYSDLNGFAVPGQPKKLYVDGKQLKAKGELFDTPLGNAVWKSLEADKTTQNEEPIRISIAFLDLAHKHGEGGKVFVRESLSSICPDCRKGLGDKIFLDGYLVHLALTRVPVNPRTIMQAEDVMANKSNIKTKKEDALSIVQDEQLVEEIENKSLETRSDILIEMSDVVDDELFELEEKAGTKGGYLVKDNGSGQPALPTKENGVLSHRLMGAAWAALHGGYRGNKYEGEGKDQAISKLKNLYKKEGMKVPSEKSQIEKDMMSGDSPEMYMPYGGATTMEDAQAYMDAQDESWRVSSLYYMFLDVASNIMCSDMVSDKADALSSAVDEFKSQLVSKSLYEEMSLLQKDGKLDEMLPVSKADIENLKSLIETKSVPVSAETTEVRENENVPAVVPETKSALVSATELVYNAVEVAKAMVGTVEEKLQSINPSLQALGEAITNEVRESSGVSTPAPIANDQSAVLEAIEGLKSMIVATQDKVAQLEAQKSTMAPTNSRPVPRQVQVPVPNLGAPSQAQNPNSVTNIVRRSVSSTLPLK